MNWNSWKMKEKHSLLNIPLYFFLCIICSVPFFIPVFVVFPNLFEGSKSDFVHHLQDNLIFLGANQVASLCGILLATYLIILKIEKSDFYHYKLTIDFKEILKGFLFGTAFFVIIIIGMQLTGVVKFSYRYIRLGRTYP